MYDILADQTLRYLISISTNCQLIYDLVFGYFQFSRFACLHYIIIYWCPIKIFIVSVYCCQSSRYKY